MTPLDPNLLDHAREAGARLIDAEKQLQIARAEYHAEIRRLHLAGASLREIAAALGMSHQRVQQIVDEAGGSWWTKVWRTRTGLHDLGCSFCGRSRADVAKLISGPDVLICDGCVERAGRVMQGAATDSTLRLVARSTRIRCSFCGERASATRPVVGASRARVCRDCLAQCRQIIEASATG